MPISTEARDHAVSQLSINAVANYADVTFDHPSDPGGGFIESVIVSFTDRLDNATDGWGALVDDEGYGPDAEDFSDVARELADGAVPVYDLDVAETWTGLRGWVHDDAVSDLVAGQNDGTLVRLQTALCVIAEQLIYACRSIARDAINEYIDGAENDAALTTTTEERA